MNYPENFDIKYLLELYGDNVIASMTNTKGQITFVSNAYEKISGYTREELLGKPHNIVRHPEMPSSTFKDLWSTIKKEKVWKGEVKNLKKDGGFYWVNATVTPQKNEQGIVIGYASIREDITDKKETIELHKQIETILNNIEDGFLIFNKDLSIKESYSLKCLDILGQNEISNKNISQVLFNNNLELQETFQYGCEKLFETKDINIQELYISLLPQSHSINTKKFTIDYKILPNNEILVLLRDITKELELENQICSEQQKYKMIITIATHKLDAIDLIESFKKFLVIDVEEIELKTLKIKLHTFKGLFSQLQMKNISEAIHIIETSIKYQTFDKSFQEKLSEVLTSELKSINEILGEQYLEPTTSINIELDQLNKLESTLHNIINSSNYNKDKLHILLEDLQEMKKQPLYDMLSIYSVTVENLSKNLAKPMFPLEILGDKHILVKEDFRNFTKSLVHVFRNSIIHGIEDEATRIEYNKNTLGKINCLFEIINNDLVIKIKDDGQGLNLSLIKQRILDLELISSEEIINLSENEIFQFIFKTDFSTSLDIDELSGRGVGLPSIVYEIEKLNGTIDIKNKPLKGLEFIFTIPFKDEKEEYIQDFTNSLYTQFETFLVNDMTIQCTKSENQVRLKRGFFTTTLNVTGKENLLYVIKIEEPLLNTLCYTFTEEQNPNNEMKNDLISEIANIVIGLSIQDFPQNFGIAQLGTPISLDQDIIISFLNNNKSHTIQIDTQYGKAELALIIID